MKILIAGRTASGKDRLRSILEAHDVSFVVSATDRPRRDSETDEHEFITASEMDALWPDAIAKTTIGTYRYAATREAVEQADAYIVDPAGVCDVCQAFPDERFLLVYVYADAAKREQVAAARNNDADATREREAAEAKVFDRFEKDVIEPNTPPEGVSAIIAINNDYQAKTMEDNAELVLGQWHLLLQMKHIIAQCRREHVLRGPEGDLDHVTIAYANRDRADVSIDEAAFQSLAMEENMPALVKAWLMLEHPETIDFTKNA